MTKVKKIKVVGVDLSSQDDASVVPVLSVVHATKSPIEVKDNEIKAIKHDYRGTQYVKDLSR